MKTKAKEKKASIAGWWDEEGSEERTLARYDAIRGKISELMLGEVKTRCNSTELKEAGRDLGLFRQGTFCFEGDEHMAILLDYAYLFSRLYGTTPCERYLKTVNRKGEDDVTKAARDALATARYAFLVMEEARPGFGVVCHDVLRGERTFLVDRNFSQTVDRPMTLAGGVFAVGSWLMTTGAILPFGLTSVEEVFDAVQTLFEDLHLPFSIPASVSPKQQTQVARVSIKAIISAGGLDHISYGYKEP